jgi:hypothetical protein
MTDTSKHWRVKYDGVCDRCGTPLLRGQPAVWDRSTKTIHCIECPQGERVIDRGTAGGSAIHEGQRRMAKRDAAARAKWGNRLGGVILALTDAPSTTRVWGIGGSAEAKLGAALDGVEGLIALHDRRVPGTRGNIDHIVIASAGVFVVDAKAHKGLVRIRDRGGLFRTDLRLYVGSRDCSRLAEGLTWQVVAVRAAFERSTVEPLPRITPVICFVEADWPIFRAPESFHGVRLESPESLTRLASGLHEQSPEAVRQIARALAAALPAR